LLSHDGDTLQKESPYLDTELAKAAADGFPFHWEDPEGDVARRCAVTFAAASEACKGPASLEQAKRRVSAASTPLRQQLRAFRSSEGFGATRWGMTRGEVQRVVRNLTLQGEGLAKRDRIAGRDAQVEYGFVQERLTVVVVTFRQQLRGSQAYFDDFESIVGILTEKYGPPEQNEVEYSPPGMRELFGGSPAAAIQLGHAQASVGWRSRATLVLALCSAGNGPQLATRVTYASAELAQWALRNSRRKQAEGL